MTLDSGVTCTNTVAYSIGFCVGTCYEMGYSCVGDVFGTTVVFMSCSDSMYSFINPFSAGTVFVDVRF